MSDIALTWNVMEATGDVAVAANDLVLEDGLQTAVLLSLFTDRRAELGDQLPAGETDRRGWWADAVPVVDGDRHGSRLWLLARETQTSATLERAERYAREALAWLLEDGVATKVDVVAEFVRQGVLALTIEVTLVSGSLEVVSTELPFTASTATTPPSIVVVDSGDAILITSAGEDLGAEE